MAATRPTTVATAAATVVATGPTSDLGAALTGAAEVPGPGDPDGGGLAEVALDPDAGQACLHLQFSNIADPTLAHIHEGPSTVAGPIVVDFTSTLAGDDCVSGVDGALLERILATPAGFYVNVHNARFPAGAIRGQLFPLGDLADEVVLPRRLPAGGRRRGRRRHVLRRIPRRRGHLPGRPEHRPGCRPRRTGRRPGGRGPPPRGRPAVGGRGSHGRGPGLRRRLGRAARQLAVGDGDDVHQRRRDRRRHGLVHGLDEPRALRRPARRRRHHRPAAQR